VFKGSFLEKHLMTQAEERGYKLEGFFGLPSDHKSNRTGQYLFVNRRPVFSPQISYAVKEAYGQRLAEDRFPVFVLHLQVPPELVDVNVHPQKREVRFQEADFIRSLIKEQLQGAFHVPSAPSMDKVFEISSKSIATWDAPLQLREAEPEEPMLVKEAVVIGLFEHYLLLDASSVEGYEPGMIWVDLQKVQEQLVWQSLTEESLIASQGLLLPVSMELTPLESQVFQHHQAQLVKCGFSVERSGKQTILIDAIPPFLDPEDIIETVHLILQSEEPFGQLASQVAHFALRRKKRFMLQEALSLWRKCRLKEAITWMGLNAIEKLFKSN
jgi:DNA mismatch repair protein MutL